MMRILLLFLWKVITSPFRFIAWLIRSIISTLKHTARGIKSYFSEEETDDTSITESFATTIENPSALLPHINALRKHLFRSVLAIIITTAISFFFVKDILAFLSTPIPEYVDKLISLDVTESIGTVMRVTLLSGFTIALPYVIFEIWLFIAPALSISSRIKGLFAIPAAIILFVGGMAFSFYVLLPNALDMLFNFMGIVTQPRTASYFNFVTTILFWVGITFEFPLAIYLLASLGIIKAKTLATQWRLAIVIIAVLAAAITPTVDPINMGLVMLPMTVLYFLSIGLAYFAQRNHKEKHKEALSNI